jgi:DNA polymerase I-like protein with 3'-5' exonuclease and polymerase domains
MVVSASTRWKKSLTSFLAIDTETTGLSLKHGCRAFAVSMCDHSGEQYYWDAPVNTNTRTPAWTQQQRDEIYGVISSYPVLVFHNALFDIRVLAYLDPRIEKLILSKQYHDTMILSHILDSKKTKSLKDLGVLELGINDTDEKQLDDLVKKLHFAAKKLKWDYARPGHPHFPGAKSKFHKMDMWLPKAYARSKHFEGTEDFKELCLSVCETYARLDAVRTAGLYHVFMERLLTDQLSHESYQLQLDVLKPLIEIEETGLHLIEREFTGELLQYQTLKDDLLASLQTYLGDLDFNPESTDQLRYALFEYFEFPVIKTTKTGLPSTDKEVLNELQYYTTNLQGRRFLRVLAKFRGCNSALKYLRSYERFQKNGILYPNMNVVGTSTTRLSSNEPNGQNVSKGKEAKDIDGNDLRDADGNPIIEYSLRKVFGPARGKVWYAVDFDQLQIRIFAFISKEKSLMEAIINGFDFHTTVAKALYGVDEPTKQQRKVAKYINFGIIFGAGERKIDHLSGVPGSFQKFRLLYPNVADYIDSVSKEVRKNGYVRTPGKYPLTVEKHKAYAGVNYQVQGAEGDIVKRSLVKIYKYLKTIQTSAKLILQVHDEIIFEVDKSEDFSNTLTKICSIMEASGEYYGVPCKAKPEIIEHNWGAPQDYWKWEESQLPF